MQLAPPSNNDEIRTLKMLLDQANGTIASLREELKSVNKEIENMRRGVSDTKLIDSVNSPLVRRSSLVKSPSRAAHIRGLSANLDDLFGSTHKTSSNDAPASFGSIAPTSPRANKMMRKASFLGSQGHFTASEKNAAKDGERKRILIFYLF